MQRPHRTCTFYWYIYYLSCMHTFFLKQRLFFSTSWWRKNNHHLQWWSTTKPIQLKTFFCHQYVLLEQPIFGIFSTACINMCILHWPKPTDIILTQSPRLDRKSIIILINLLYLQTQVKKISKLILPCLEAHFGDLITFQPYGHFQPGMTSRHYTTYRLLRHEGKLPKHTWYCATWQ